MANKLSKYTLTSKGWPASSHLVFQRFYGSFWQRPRVIAKIGIGLVHRGPEAVICPRCNILWKLTTLLQVLVSASVKHSVIDRHPTKCSRTPGSWPSTPTSMIYLVSSSTRSVERGLQETSHGTCEYHRQTEVADINWNPGGKASLAPHGRWLD